MLVAVSDPKTSAFRKVPLLAHCSKQELGFVASRADELDLPAGRRLTRQGDPGDAFYILLGGEAEVEVDGRPRRTLKPGDFFGEISMLDRGPSTATVVTSTPAHLVVMSHSQFRDAIKGNDELLTKVLAAMGERLRADLRAREAASFNGPGAVAQG
jgi:CRP-like cAMP-binding protein